MKRSKRLKTVVDMAAKASEAASIKLAEAHASWLREKQQLEQCQQYKNEYIERFRRGEGNVLNAQKVLELRSFLLQLDQTIQAQQQQVDLQRQQLDQQRTRWRKTRSKEQTMQSLVERYHDEELKLESKQEQQSSDERNIILWRHQAK